MKTVNTTDAQREMLSLVYHGNSVLRNMALDICVLKINRHLPLMF